MARTLAKPVVVLVHGAWHRPMHYLHLIDSLQELGYRVLAPSLAATGSIDLIGQKTVEDDVKIIRQTFLPIIEEDKEVIVICHSYGGIPATDSIVGYTVNERKVTGAGGGVKALIYMAAFAPPQAGLSLLNIIGAHDSSGFPPWWSRSGDYAILSKEAQAAFYEDLDETVAISSLQITVQQSYFSFESACVKAASEVTARKIFFACKNDNAIPYEGQVAMSQAAQAEMISLDCGHSPFLQKKFVSQMIDRIEEVALSA